MTTKKNDGLSGIATAERAVHLKTPKSEVDVMPFLLNPQNSSFDAAHKYLVLSREVLIAGKWKLLMSQPSFKSQNNGWKDNDVLVPTGAVKPSSECCAAYGTFPSRLRPRASIVTNAIKALVARIFANVH